MKRDWSKPESSAILFYAKLNTLISSFPKNKHKFYCRYADQKYTQKNDGFAVAQCSLQLPRLALLPGYGF